MEEKNCCPGLNSNSKRHPCLAPPPLPPSPAALQVPRIMLRSLLLPVVLSCLWVSGSGADGTLGAAGSWIANVNNTAGAGRDSPSTLAAEQGTAGDSASLAVVAPAHGAAAGPRRLYTMTYVDSPGTPSSVLVYPSLQFWSYFVSTAAGGPSGSWTAAGYDATAWPMARAQFG